MFLAGNEGFIELFLAGMDLQILVLNMTISFSKTVSISSWLTFLIHFGYKFTTHFITFQYYLLFIYFCLVFCLSLRLGHLNI